MVLGAGTDVRQRLPRAWSWAIDCPLSAWRSMLSNKCSLWGRSMTLLLSLRFAAPLAGAAIVLATTALPAAAAPADQATPQAQPSTAQPQVTTLVGVQSAPAVPAGRSATARHAAARARRYSQPVGPFTMFMEVLGSASPSQFRAHRLARLRHRQRLQARHEVVFRFEIYDMDNKVRLTTADGTTAQVHLPDGTSLPAIFLPRGDPGAISVTHPGPGSRPGRFRRITRWARSCTRWMSPRPMAARVITPPSIPGQPVVPGVPLALAGTYPTIIP